jgi:hypothetical protein
VSNARSRLAAYGRTPKALLRDPDIRPIAKILYTMIDEVAGHEDITIERMAEWLGVNVKTARKALHEIRDAGWIEVVEVIEGQRGQAPSEYIANAYSFQHLSEGSEEVSSMQAADQAGRSGALPLSSTPMEKSGTPPSQKVPTSAGTRGNPGDPGILGLPKSGTPGDYQKVVPPTYLRDDETVTTTGPARTDGFREFWTAFPDGGYKYRRDECRKIWLDLSKPERYAAWNMLMAYKTSILWVEEGKIHTPHQWLLNEPWLGDKPQQVKVRKMFSADDVALSD